jgi:CCR4-NOT transcription complex subunit 4
MDISNDENALETLRGPSHFGQYGEIIKIVASKAKEGYAGHQSTGIYVTFARKEDAQTCIAAVDGTPHDGRVLR